MSRLAVVAILASLLSACAPTAMSGAPDRRPAGTDPIRVVAAESFLADIAQNVAGDRLQVDTLIPLGVDPHGFQPTPADVRKVAGSDVLIVNGAGFEEFLRELLDNAGGQGLVVEAAEGLPSRSPSSDEGGEDAGHSDRDPHYWLDPNMVIKYAENIRDGLSEADPGGADAYAANADGYIAQLKELDRWIADQVSQVPQEARQLVTNHETFGYFADRYGFKIVGTILPGTTSNASPSAQQLAGLVDAVKRTGVKAVFLETGSNPQLANQLARDTGVRVVTDIYTHSLTGADGPAPTYLDMMRYDTRTIVEALQ